MAEIYVTADTHFGHAAIIGMCARPFLAADDMDEEMIRRWNDRVRRGDTVYHLGDFGMKASAERLTEVFARLNGIKHLVVGNHDKAKTTSLPWASPPRDRLLLRHPGERLPIVCDHYALRTWPGLHYGAVHLYGHSHGNLRGVGRSVDVGVDVWDFRPVTLDELRPTLERQQAVLDDARSARDASEVDGEDPELAAMRDRAARGDPAKALDILERLPSLPEDDAKTAGD